MEFVCVILMGLIAWGFFKNTASGKLPMMSVFALVVLSTGPVCGGFRPFTSLAQGVVRNNSKEGFHLQSEQVQGK